MKHILKYNLFESNDNKYYYKITIVDYCGDGSGYVNKSMAERINDCSFSKNEVNAIESSIPPKYDCKLLKGKVCVSQHSSLPDSFDLNQITSININFPDREFLTFNKAGDGDEWYYIMYYYRFREDDDHFGNYEESYFKCDQLEGLKVFLNDFFNDKTNFKN